MEEVILVSIPINKKVYEEYKRINSELGYFEKEIPERLKVNLEESIISENIVYGRAFPKEENSLNYN